MYSRAHRRASALYTFSFANLSYRRRKQVLRIRDSYDPFTVDPSPELNLSKISPCSTVFKDIDVQSLNSNDLPLNEPDAAQLAENTEKGARVGSRDDYVKKIREQYALPESASGFFEPVDRKMYSPWEEDGSRR